jgi:hypothetical protein
VVILVLGLPFFLYVTLSDYVTASQNIESIIRATVFFSKFRDTITFDAASHHLTAVLLQVHNLFHSEFCT